VAGSKNSLPLGMGSVKKTHILGKSWGSLFCTGEIPQNRFWHIIYVKSKQVEKKKKRIYNISGG